MRFQTFKYATRKELGQLSTVAREGTGLRSLIGQNVFSSPERPDPLCSPHSLDTGASLCVGAERPDGGADYSSPSNCKLKQEWSCTSTTPHAFTVGTETTSSECARKRNNIRCEKVEFLWRRRTHTAQSDRQVPW